MLFAEGAKTTGDVPFAESCQAEAAQHRHRLRGAAFIIGVEEFCRLRHTAQVCEEEELPLFCIALLLCTL